MTSAKPMPSFENLAPVAQAIDYLVAHAEDQPSLDDVAAICGLSPHHFQRLFKAGAGVSPKRFLQYLTASRAREALRAGQSVLEASYAAGLSGPSRLHDLALVSDAMTPGRVRKKGDGVTIHYDRIAGPVGHALIGATDKGICWLSFEDRDGAAAPERELRELQAEWPQANLVHDAAFVAPIAQRAFDHITRLRTDTAQTNDANQLGLHVQGTNFQLKVWEALMRIPHGACVTYGDIARAIGKPKASRAVGSAVGANPICVLIPCHRVIRASGVIQNYRWGPGRKNALLALEAASHENAAACEIA